MGAPHLLGKHPKPPVGSQVDVEGLQDHLAAQGAVALVDVLLQQHLCALLAQAQVPAGQQQHCLGLVLADDTFLTLLLLFQQHPGVVDGADRHDEQ
uniref:Uncharacterized protein n=1 Tax=Ficedula albicollis TaxID=59894 RepID=A0A803VQC3_FICAL